MDSPSCCYHSIKRAAVEEAAAAGVSKLAMRFFAVFAYLGKNNITSTVVLLTVLMLLWHVVIPVFYQHLSRMYCQHHIDITVPYSRLLGLLLFRGTI